MRAHPRRRLRLLARDGAALCAFGAMAISGELPAWNLGLFGAGALVALLDLRALRRAPVLSGAAVAVGAALLGAAAAQGRMDLVVAACAFASLLTLHRMLSAPSARTDSQVLLTSLLMISGGAALTGDLLFAVMLAAFAICACYAMSLGVVERAIPEGADFDTRPVLRRATVGVALALAGAVAFFFVIPRFSWNVAGRRFARGFGAAAGLSDGIRLGETGGAIKTNPRIVARAELEPDPGRDHLDAYWVAATYALFTGTEWRGDRPPLPPDVRVDLRPGGEGVVHQRIELLPAYGSRAALALAEPAMFGNAIGFDERGRARVRFAHHRGQEVRIADAADGYVYHAYSVDPRAPWARADLTDAELTRYVALPELDRRIDALAARVIGGERDPLAAAERLRALLLSEYRYTLELPERSDDPLADFLFARKEGHCEFFASALAVLLRTQGFASRVAVGFYGGERIGGGYVVRAGDAHAWTQVWVPGRGFVNVDATPPSFRGAQPSPVLEWLIGAYERVDGWWRGQVLDYSIRDQMRFVTRVARADRGEPGRARLPRPPADAWAAAALVAVGTWLAFRLWSRRRGSQAVGEATILRARAEALLARRGLAQRPGEGFEEHVRRVSRARPELRRPLEALCRRYLEARFGGRPLADGEAAALMAGLRRACEHPAPRRAA